MERFARWFASTAGVVQTGACVAGIAVYELANPHWDAHGFWLLWALTVYSAVTQPVLAYSAARSARHAERNERKLYHLEQKIDHKFDKLLEELHR